MTDAVQGSSEAAPAGGSTSSNNGIGKPEKVKIPMASSGGGFSFDEFNRATGKETPSSATDEPNESEEDEDSGELRDPPEATEDAKIEDKKSDEDEEEESDAEEEAEEGEEADELDEISKNTKKGIKAFTKDGKQLTLPPDLEIEQMVDGELRKINLREHLNVVAGEMSVESRLGKLSSFREQVEQRRKEIERVHTKFSDDIQTLTKYAAAGRPDLAICFLAEMRGTSPIEMKKQFLKAIVAEAAKFEGKSDVEIDNHYLQLENRWRANKEKRQREANEHRQKSDSWVQAVTNELKKENISPEEFSAARKELHEGGELEGLSREAVLDRVIERALLVKHESMAKEAIEKIDPKLLKNKKIMDLLLDHTHPNKFTVDEMADVLAEYLGKEKTRIASGLSKKVRPLQKVTAKSEKQNEAGQKKRVYRSQGDLARAFGL